MASYYHEIEQAIDEAADKLERNADLNVGAAAQAFEVPDS